MKLVGQYLDDLAALVMIIGCIVLLALRIDGEVKSILTVAAGYMFGKRVPFNKPK